MAIHFILRKKGKIGVGCWLLAGLCMGAENRWELKKEKLSTNLYYFMGKGLPIPLEKTTVYLVPEETILNQREKMKNPYVEGLHTSRSKAQDKLKTIHQQLELDPTQLDTSIKNKLLSQLRPFFSSPDYQHLQEQLSGTHTLSVDQDLLPPFARSHIKRFPIYRGPNCFHTAISFSYPEMVDSDFLNPRWEKTYHPHMLNGDEILRALAIGFYPIETLQTLQYGDVLIFLENSSNSQIPVHVKIKHAMVYLFSNYVFSKASKSADSPYHIEKLESEWKIWGQLPDLEIKVFRKKPIRDTTLSSFVPYDWRS
jgi:hypothetical protein